MAYIRFYAALSAQGIDRSTLFFRSPFQPFLAWYGAVIFAIITFFNGFDTVAGGFKWQSFITCYIGFPIFIGLFVFWKIFKQTSIKTAANADLLTGKEEVDAQEWPDRVPRNFLERVWFWIA